MTKTFFIISLYQIFSWIHKYGLLLFIIHCRMQVLQIDHGTSKRNGHHSRIESRFPFALSSSLHTNSQKFKFIEEKVLELKI